MAEKRNIYAKHLAADAIDEAWSRFESALRPFHDADKLGAVLFQYLPWFGPRKDNRAEIEAWRERLPDYRISVEVRSPRWLAQERDRERTLKLLEEHGLVFVCVDAPSVSELPRITAVINPELFIPEHAREARETHLLMNNCYRDYAVLGAAQLRDIVAGYAD